MKKKIKETFGMYGVDVDDALKRLKEIPVSVHCWQGDDVVGLDGGGAASGGIQTTGNYKGRARTKEELFDDIRFAFSLMPGKKRLNLHASYAILGDDAGKVDRDGYKPEYFAEWVALAKELKLDGIDFNPTCFSHKNVKDGLTLSSPDENIRNFWIRHCIACLKITEYFADEMKSNCLVNIWIPDGFKDVPADRLAPRLRLKDSLDKILACGYDRSKVTVCVESKVFGIGVESYTVGNSEFYQNYAAKNGICCLLDNGHYHPTEVVSDKIPSMLAFYDTVALHVTRPVRWDSDHVVLLEDELKEIAKEIIRNGAEKKVRIGLDYFDASINRIMAWVIGQRNMQKALLYALLQPYGQLKKLQDDGDFTALMYMQETLKDLPYGEVWRSYLEEQGLSDKTLLVEIRKYEKQVSEKRI